MSHEYVASLELTARQVAMIAQGIAGDGQYEIAETDHPLRFRFVFAAMARDRSRWPFDGELHFDGGVYVAFHTGDTHLHDTFITKLRALGCLLGKEINLAEE